MNSTFLCQVAQLLHLSKVFSPYFSFFTAFCQVIVESQKLDYKIEEIIFVIHTGLQFKCFISHHTQSRVKTDKKNEEIADQICLSVCCSILSPDSWLLVHFSYYQASCNLMLPLFFLLMQTQEMTMAKTMFSAITKPTTKPTGKGLSLAIGSASKTIKWKQMTGNTLCISSTATSSHFWSSCLPFCVMACPGACPYFCLVAFDKRVRTPIRENEE